MTSSATSTPALPGAPAITGPAQPILLGRSLERIQPVIDSIASINASIPHIDVLTNNAAVMACPYTLTAGGFKLQLAAAHFGHFVLTNRLIPKLLAAGPHARVVNVSSLANRLGDIRFDNPNYVARPSTPSLEPTARPRRPTCSSRSS